MILAFAFIVLAACFWLRWDFAKQRELERHLSAVVLGRPGTFTAHELRDELASALGIEASVSEVEMACRRLVAKKRIQVVPAASLIQRFKVAA